MSLSRVAQALPFTFTGADLYALCSDAMLKAVTRSAREVDERVAAVNHDRLARGQSTISIGYYFDHYDTEREINVMVTEDDFTLARRDLIPSVSVDELQHYERVRNMFEGTSKKEDAANGHGASTRSVQNGEHLSGRKQAMGAMKRAQASGSPNGSGDGPILRSSTADADADDSDYIIRTDGLSLTSNGGGTSSSSKGKGKGKSREAASDPEWEHHNDAGETEDLYD